MNGDWLPGSTDSGIGTDRLLGGRYRLISQVGTGGMAVVWQAHDSVLARTVAVKVLAAHYADDPESRDRIRQEARAAAVLSHPNIAQVYDYGEADVAGEVVPYVVMELIRGGTLQQRLCDGPVLPRYAMRVCAEIAAALAAAHAEGLAHRDIKPANVMLGPTGAKVVDFGIAAAIGMPGSGADEFEVLGTPAYLAPERLLYDAVEPASDVYALGVLLYRLLAGHSPWTIETTTQMLTAHIYLAPAPLLPMFQVPDSVTALCNRCLAKDPAQRPSAREAAALLANGAGLPVNADEPPSREQTAIDPEPSVPPEAVPTGTGGDATEPTAGKRSRAAYALAAVALLAAVAATLWLLHSPHRQSALSQAAPTAAASAGPPAAVGPLPGASTATATTAPARLGGGPPVVGGATVPGPVPAPAAPGKPTSAAPGTTAGPGPTVTTTAPAAEPPERTLSSSAGSVRAKCPAPRTAQILSWTATKPYKVTEGDKGAGPSPAVSFKHGNTHITMTVTCAGGVPSATTT